MGASSLQPHRGAPVRLFLGRNRRAERQAADARARIAPSTTPTCALSRRPASGASSAPAASSSASGRTARRSPWSCPSAKGPTDSASSPASCAISPNASDAETRSGIAGGAAALLPRSPRSGRWRSTLAHEINQPLIGDLELCARREAHSRAHRDPHRCATRSTRQPIRRFAPARSCDGCATSSRRDGARARKPRQADRGGERPGADRRQGARDRAAIPAHGWKRKVFVDRVQIQQVLLNLIRNAIDSMEDAPAATRCSPSRSRRRRKARLVVNQSHRHGRGHRA